MDTSIFFKEEPFHLWTLQHAMPVIIYSLIGICAIWYAKKKLDRSGQKILLLGLSLVPAIAFGIHTILKLSMGTYTIQDDLPFHICRILALTAPIVYWKENKFWGGIFYFWILAGTLNAVITADIRHAYPHWNYFIYFIMHLGLIPLPIYFTVVLGYKIKLRDLWNAFWMANVFLILTMIINFSIQSNYMFTRHKPEVATIMDALGPWPWYLVALQFIAVILFAILYLPFYLSNRKS